MNRLTSLAAVIVAAFTTLPALAAVPAGMTADEMFEKGYLYEYNEQTDSALYWYEQALLAGKTEALLDVVNSALELYETDKAEQYAERYYMSCDNDNIATTLGNIFVNHYEHKLAEKWYLKGESRNESEAFFQLGKCYLDFADENQVELANTHFLRYAEIKNREKGLSLIGYEFYTHEYYDMAMSWYNKALALDETDAYYYLGRFYGPWNKDYTDKAKARNYYTQYFDRCHDISLFIETPSSIAFDYLNNDDYDEAMFWFNKSVDYHDIDGNAYYNIADIYLDKNYAGYNVATAQEYFEKQMAYSRSWVNEVSIGSEFYVAGEYQLAEQWYQKALDDEYNGAEACFCLAKLYLIEDNPNRDISKAENYFALAKAKYNQLYFSRIAKEFKEAKEYEKAYEWYLKALDAGETGFDKDLGDIFSTREFSGYNLNKAYECYLPYARKWYGEDEYQYFKKMSESCSSNNDKEGEIFWLTKAAELGDAASQNNVGLYYYRGTDVPQDYEKALYWFRKAAEQDEMYALYNLGICYYYGHGVKQDYKQAYEWYLKSAEYDYANAENYIGLCYENGYGVKQDYKQAVEWFNKAVEKNDKHALYNLGRCYYYGRGVDMDYKRAVELFKKSAEQGHPNAENYIGICYENGYGVTQDYKQAVKWYRKAAEQGERYAQYNLGYCYYYGNGVEQDYKQAAEWYRKSANQGYVKAINNLGLCYEKGNGVPRDDNKAFELYSKAAKGGNMVAMYNMGQCYRYGRGVTPNIDVAVSWYKKSAAEGYQSAKDALSELNR